MLFKQRVSRINPSVFVVLFVVSFVLCGYHGTTFGSSHVATVTLNPDDNLLPNPGFEHGLGDKGYPLSWRGSPLWAFGKEYRFDENEAREGKVALVIDHPEDYHQNIHFRIDEDTHRIPVNEGDVFELTAYARNLSGKTAMVTLIYLDENNREISGTNASRSTTSKTWHKLEITTQPAPPEAKSLRILLFSTRGQAGSISMFDDFYLRKVDLASLRIPPQVDAGQHPRVYMTQAEIDVIQQLGRKNPAVGSLIQQIIYEPAQNMVRKYDGETIVLPEKPPNDQGEVIMRGTDPIHRRYASDALAAAFGYAFYGDEAMGNTVKKILLTYADEYMNFSHRAVREGRLTSETREESLWLIDMVWAYDLVVAGDVLNADEKDKVEAMFREAARIIDDHRQVRVDVNWQATHNSALAAVGFLLEDKTLIQSVLVGPKSFTDLVGQKVRHDGMALSQSISHHWYDVGRWFLVAEAAYRSGYDLYRYSFDGKTLKDMVDFPFNYVFSHGEHPLTGHANYGTRLQFRWQVAAAYARYQDPKYLWLWSEDGLKNLVRQGDNQRSIIFLPILYSGLSADEPTYTISFGAVGPAGRNMSGSTLLSDSGFTILRGKTANGTLLESVMLFKPHGTVNGHQGYDNLTMMLAGKDGVWIPGTGSHSYAFDYPEQRGWYEQTLARSGVVVDQMPQYPLRGTDTRYAVDRGGRSSAGKLLSFIALPSVSLAKATTDKVYEGVDMERTLLLSAPYMIDRYNVRSDEEHLYDWVVHVRATEGDIDLPQTSRPGTLGEQYGYQYITQLRTGTTSDGWSGTWTKPSETMQVSMLGSDSTEVIRGQGLGIPVTPQPLVMARRQTDRTEFVALYELYDEKPTVVAISSIDGSINNSGADDLQGVRIDRADGQVDRWVWSRNPASDREPIRIEPRLAFSGREAFFRSPDASKIRSALVVGGTFLQVHDMTIRANSPADIALESLGHDVMTVTQSSDRPVTITLEARCHCGSTFRLFQLTSSNNEGGRVVAKEISGLKEGRPDHRLALEWTAEPNVVYVLGTQRPTPDWLDRFAIEMTL